MNALICRFRRLWLVALFCAAGSTVVSQVCAFEALPDITNRDFQQDFISVLKRSAIPRGNFSDVTQYVGFGLAPFCRMSKANIRAYKSLLSTDFVNDEARQRYFTSMLSQGGVRVFSVSQQVVQTFWIVYNGPSGSYRNLPIKYSDGSGDSMHILILPTSVPGEEFAEAAVRLVQHSK